MDNRRQHQRFRAAVAAEVEIDAELYEGETRDLSSGGAAVLLRARAPLTDGMQLSLTLLLTEDGIETPDEESLTLQAQVVWITPAKQGAMLAGLSFLSPTAEQKQRLESLLSALKNSVQQ
jgi:c-di-GMP-binding flagellar brake protein YcgR